MNTRSELISGPELRHQEAKASWLDGLARRVVRTRLSGLQAGEVTIVEGGKSETFGGTIDGFGVSATIRVHSPAFYSDVAFGGSVGAGESYINGNWECDELDSLVRILLRNRGALDSMESGTAWLALPLRKFLHRLNRNTRRGSRRNIAAHYDLGNEFYRLWLDPEMMYSAAWYPDENASLETASVAKLDRICRKLNLSERDSVIEIGTGWGGFAIHAAKHYGCHVTTTTISGQQHDYARARIEAEGLSDRIRLLRQDYRDLEGRFDKLVSIEMIEAVGHEFLDTFFSKCGSLLKSDGEMLIQAITIADQRYEKAKRSVDFIKRYIFPGGFLPSVTAMTRSMTRVSKLRMVDLEDIGLHYARTLGDWRARFFDRLDEVREQGFSNEFIRMWEYYLCYCEGAFTERAIGNVQLHAIAPDARPPMHRAG